MRTRSLGMFGPVVAVLAAVVPAQVSATLVANAPMTVGWDMGGSWGSGSNTFPAGPLTVDGSLLTTVPGGLGGVRLDWVVPQPGSASCSFRASRQQNSSLTYSSSADLTMSVSGPIGQRGHVKIVLLGWDDAASTTSLLVDVGDDGSNEANSQAAPSVYIREWRIPAALGPGGLDIRVRHFDAGPPYGPGKDWNVTLAFEPIADCATDLGSSCAINDVGWVLPPSPSVYANHPYFLHAAPGGGGALCELIARGHGPIAAFCFAVDPTRVAPGWLGVGLGCDDLLQNVAFTLPGDVIAAETWSFAVPALPPGVTFWVQHASFGPGPGWYGSAPIWRTGVTNLVRVDS